MTTLITIWSNPRGRGLIWQGLALLIAAVLLLWVASNVQHNLSVRQISSGFGFLWREAGLPIGETPISYTPIDTYARAYFVGFLNTLRVSTIGVVLATVLGTAIGIARLSPNWILAKLALGYVEIVRGIPLLLHLLIIYTILQGLPSARGALEPVSGVFLSNRGLVFPAVFWSNVALLVICATAAILAILFLVRRKAVRNGAVPSRLCRANTALVIFLIGIAGFALAQTAFGHMEYPSKQGFNIQGGSLLSPEYAALLTGLVIYSAAFIAEIVRSGIVAVGSGQWEAAQSLGLRRMQVLKKVVLPQALRIIIPPMTSQYLNLMKNSSLAVAIGYQDIVSIVNTSINQTGQALEGITVIMVTYLLVSLSISFFMNWYNRTIALEGR